MANNSRAHAGERLCKRGLRHALDSGATDTLRGNIALAKHSRRARIVVDNDIIASMKKTRRLGASAFNDAGLLATSCGCRAGCQNESFDKLGESRVACAHAFGRLAQTSQLLF